MTRHNHFALALLLSLLLTGCSSIPLSTMWRMKGFDERNLAALNGRDLRVRVLMPAPTKLVLDKTMLNATFGTEHGSHSGLLKLEQESLREVTRQTGLLFTEDVRHWEYVLRLDPTSLQQFEKIQQLLPKRSIKQTSKIEFTTNFTDMPTGQDSLTMTVELLLSPQEGYFTLLDEATLKFTTQTE